MKVGDCFKKDDGYYKILSLDPRWHEAHDVTCFLVCNDIITANLCLNKEDLLTMEPIDNEEFMKAFENQVNATRALLIKDNLCNTLNEKSGILSNLKSKLMEILQH